MGSKPNVWVRPRRDTAAAAARVSLYVQTVSRVPPFVRWISSPSGSGILDVLGGELHGLEEAGALVEHLVRLVVRLVGDLEHLIDGLLGHDRSHDRLDVFALVEHHAVLLRQRPCEVDAGEEAFGDEDLAELAATLALLLPGEGLVQLLPRQEPFLDEELPERRETAGGDAASGSGFVADWISTPCCSVNARASVNAESVPDSTRISPTSRPSAAARTAPTGVDFGQQAFCHEECSKRLPGIRSDSSQPLSAGRGKP